MNGKKHSLATKAFLVLAIIAMIGFVGCAKKGETFTGTGDGRNGKITVSINVADGKIVGGKIVSEEETDFAKPAAKQVLDQAIKNGNVDNIDAVTGATITSEGTVQAIKAALAAASGITVTQEKATDAKCQIVVIGAGGAGMTAAYQAKAQGFDVILVEKTGVVGGNTNSSTGGLNASQTSIQAKLGIEDSNEQYYEDTMKGGYDINDPELVRTLTEKSAEIVDFLIGIGADLTDVGKMAGSTNSRTHRPQGGAAVGTHLVKVLKEACEKVGVDLRLNTECTGIILENGKAVGISVSAENGNYTIRADAVIIATGGFGANSDIVVSYVPSLAGFGTTNHPGATGDAIAWAMAVGADFVDMEQIQTHPTVVPGKGIMITEAVRGNGAIIVNHEGERFCSEMATRDVMSKAILEQKGQTAYLVFDQDVRASLKAIEGYANQGLLTEAPTVAELAKKLGIPEDTMVKTLADYAVAQKTGNDPIGRKASEMPRSLEMGPYYAVEIGPAIHHTMGGIKINTNAEVISTKGTVIPGLFAAGEVTGGVHGGNRLGGNAVADIEIFGKIAADSAIAYLK